MENKEAYRIIAKHTFVARRSYAGDATLIILLIPLRTQKEKRKSILGLELCLYAESKPPLSRRFIPSNHEKGAFTMDHFPIITKEIQTNFEACVKKTWSRHWTTGCALSAISGGRALQLWMTCVLASRGISPRARPLSWSVCAIFAQAVHR